MPPRLTTERQIEVFCERYEEEPNTGCFIWIAARSAAGYGQMSWDGKIQYAHRIAWFLIHGEWPKQTIDHLCRNRPCVNPVHLEDVEHRINCQRGLQGAWQLEKVTCPNGHPYDMIDKRGARRCRQCYRDKLNTARRKRRRERALRSA